MPPFLALLLRFRGKGVAARDTRGDMSVPSTAVLGLSGRGIGALAFSCTATGEERYFCCTLDRCGLGPAPHTVSQRSGKDPSPLRSVPRLIFGRAAPTSHQASGLHFAPALCCRGSLMYTPNTLTLYIRNTFALTEFSGVHSVSKGSHLAYKLAHLTWDKWLSQRCSEPPSAMILKRGRILRSNIVGGRGNLR